jgi:hypothetical protein
MSRPLVDLLFRPRGVVVYGASSDPDKLSGRPLDYLQRFGYAGRIHVVNPPRTEVQGVRSYADPSGQCAPLPAFARCRSDLSRRVTHAVGDSWLRREAGT